MALTGIERMAEDIWWCGFVGGGAAGEVAYRISTLAAARGHWFQLPSQSTARGENGKTRLKWKQLNYVEQERSNVSTYEFCSAHLRVERHID